MKNGLYTTKHTIEVIAVNNGISEAVTDDLKIFFLSHMGEVHIVSIISKLENALVVLPTDHFKNLLDSIKQHAAKAQ